MILPDSIKTITSYSEFKFKEKGSLFLAKSYPIESETEALNHLNIQKKELYDATHHCYSIKQQDGFVKYSDDGEPNGTAGIRIFNAQNHFELTNIITIVIRYFGGTKLGIGPLGKAYYDAAFGVLENCKIIEKKLLQNITLIYDFSQSKNIHYLISKYKLRIIQNSFEKLPKISLLIHPNQIKELEEELKTYKNKISILNVDELGYF